MLLLVLLWKACFLAQLQVMLDEGVLGHLGDWRDSHSSELLPDLIDFHRLDSLIFFL